jgi:hypothetical protein
MTEVDLSQLFGQQGRPSPEYVKAAEAFNQAVMAYERQLFASAAFFGPIICCCDPHYDWDEPRPAQMHCPVPNHGTQQADRETGALYMFRVPKHW